MAVHGDRVPKEASAAHRRREAPELAPVRSRARWIGIRDFAPGNYSEGCDTRKHAQQLHDVPAFHCQVANLDVRERSDGVGVFSIDRFALRSDFYSLRHLPHCQLNVAQGNALVRGQDNPLPLVSLEAGLFNLDRVGPGTYGSEDKFSARAAHQHPGGSRSLVRQRNVRLRDHGAGSVQYPAADFSRNHLGGGAHPE